MFYATFSNNRQIKQKHLYERSRSHRSEYVRVLLKCSFHIDRKLDSNIAMK